MAENREMTIEICCGSYEDALAAARGGAERIELNSALALGGLTPSAACLRMVKRCTDLLVVSMVRPRGAGFCYTEAQTEQMFEEARELLENGSDGLAFGFLTEDRCVDLEKTGRMTELIHSYGREAVFHRAFDCTEDPVRAIEELIGLGADRILTSGQQRQCRKCKGPCRVYGYQTAPLLLPILGEGCHYCRGRGELQHRPCASREGLRQSE